MTETHSRPVSRRTLAKGAAWSVPAVAVASAVPAYAASRWHVWFEPLGLACKLPGASCASEVGITKGYVIRVRVCHDIPYPTQITVRDAMVSLGGGPSSLWQVSAADFDCPIGTAATTPDPDAGQQADVVLNMGAASASQPACCIIDFGIEGQPDSSNGSISGTAPFSWVAPTAPDTPNSGTGTIALQAASTPPCTNCEITGSV